MLFKGNKALERGRFQKVAIEDAVEFNCTMQDPRIEVYACSIGFIGQNRAEQVKITQLLLEYFKYANVALEDNLKELTKYSQNNLVINIVEGKALPYQLLYSLLEAKLVVLQKYLAKFIK